MNLKEMLEKRGKVVADIEALEAKGVNAETRASYEQLITEGEALGKEIALTQRADGLKNERFQIPKNEKRKYNLQSVLRSMVPSATGLIDIGFEREVSQELMLRGGQACGANGMMVPFEAICKRANENTTATAAGIVETQAGEYTDYLYPQTVLDKLGAVTLTGLTSNVEWPVQKNDLRPGAKTEIAAGSNIASSIPSAIATPHRVADDYPVSIQLLMQSNPSIENVLRMEIENAMRSKLEYYFFNGTGSDGQMRGLLNLSGIGSYTNTGGTFSWANAIAAKKTMVGLGFDSSACGWALGSTAWSVAASTPKASGVGNMVWENGQIVGYQSAESDNVGAGNALLMYMRSIYLQYWGGGIEIYRNESIQRSSGQIVFNLSAFADITATRPGFVVKNSVTIA